jgi:hypothetical protein
LRHKVRRDSYRVKLIDENGGGPGVRLKKRQQKKAQRTA